MTTYSLQIAYNPERNRLTQWYTNCYYSPLRNSYSLQFTVQHGISTLDFQLILLLRDTL